MNTTAVALVGTPNVGKSSLFNLLTKLNQKIGNYPGVTVDKKTGTFKHREVVVEITDLPGTHSLYPNSKDEEVVFNYFTDRPLGASDRVVLVAHAAHLKQSLLLYRQLDSLGTPMIIALNMLDEAQKKGIQINITDLSKELGVPIVPINARNGYGLKELKQAIIQASPFQPSSIPYKIPTSYQAATAEVQKVFLHEKPYLSWLYLAYPNISHLHPLEKDKLNAIRKKHDIIPKRLQVKETIDHYAQNKSIIEKVAIFDTLKKQHSLTERIDAVLVHKIWGLVILLTILLFVFQALFEWSSVPMDWIEGFSTQLGTWVHRNLPPSGLSRLISEGLIPGITGVVIFIPQIALLFFFLALMEESGYMSRVVFLTDKWLRPFGLSGKSIIALMSGVACAIPAVMSTRNIENPKERLLSILVTPFMTCSARLPVYAFVITIVIPSTYIGFFSLQALVLMGLYLLGFIAALFSAFLLKFFISAEHSQSFLLMEMPNYRVPVVRNVLFSIYGKVKSFVFDAGKIIVAVSIVLWFLGSYGSDKSLDQIKMDIKQQQSSLTENEITVAASSYQLKHSYLGQLGQMIEPLVQPLGYNWKLGIALISSIAAREVFVGTLANIYSIDYDALEEDQINLSLKDKMSQEINPINGKPIINLASGISLLLFYALAMQCISTLAVVKRETHSWKWPTFQLLYMTGLAYIFSFITYQLLS